MPVAIGYLLPTREGVMEARHEAVPVVDLAERAESLGLDSVWIGDSVIAKPRHEPLTMLAAIAGRTSTIAMGTAVLLPILRNPVLLAQQLATLDQVSLGRAIIGIGIGQDLPAVRAEFEAVGVPFEKRVGRLIEGFQLCKALWTGEPVTWEGRWTLRDAVLGPKPHTPGGPPIWAAGGVPNALKRCGRYYDGWFPPGPSDPGLWAANWRQVLDYAREAGRDPDDMVGAAYLTLSVDADETKANDRLNAYLERYYNQPAEGIRRRQGGYAGSREGAVEWLRGFVEGGATHLCLRFVGDHERSMEMAAKMRAELRGG